LHFFNNILLLIFLTLGLFSFSGCGDDDEVTGNQETATSDTDNTSNESEEETNETTQTEETKTVTKKLLAIYMVGSDLEGTNGYAGTRDFQEIIKGVEEQYNNDLTDKLDIIVAFGGTNKDGWRGMKIANFTQILEDSKDTFVEPESQETLSTFGNSDNYLFKDDSFNMGDDASLKYFLNYLKTNNPLSDYNKTTLVMWDHGGAYGLFGNDENYNNDGLTLVELKESFDEADLKFDVIGFDACLNGNIEIAKTIKTHADYLIGSEELEPGHGWNWTNLIKSYEQNNTIEDFGKSLIDNFVLNSSHTEADEDGNFQSGGEKTLSIVKLANLDSLITELNTVASLLEDKLDDEEFFKKVSEVALKTQFYGKHKPSDKRTAGVAFDLKHFATLLENNTTDENIKNALSSLISSVENYVVYSKDDGTKPNSFGVSIAHIDLISLKTDKAYSQTEQAISDEWFNLLDAYRSVASNDQTPPTIGTVETGYEIENKSVLITKLTDNVIVYGADALFGYKENDTFHIMRSEGFIQDGDSTSTDYYAFTWDQKTVYMSYNGEDIELPLFAEKRVLENGQNYTYYSILLDNGNENTEEFLTIVLDSNQNFSKYYIEQNNLDADGNVIHDRSNKNRTFKVGDSFQFISIDIDMTAFNQATTEDDKFKAFNFENVIADINFTSVPTFKVGDSSHSLENYMILAYDNFDNTQFTELLDYQ
jgi:hypothetical protein